MGWATGPHIQAPRTHSQWVAGPGRTTQGRAVGRGRAPNPGRPKRRQEAPPPVILLPPPKRAKPARNSARCEVGDGSPRPHPRHPQRVVSGHRPHAPSTGGRAWETTQLRTPHTQARGTSPRAPRSAPRGVGDGSLRPQPPHPQPVGSRPWPHAPSMGGRARESAQPRAPYTQARDAPPLGALVPPPQRAKPARKSAGFGVGDGSPRPPPRHP